MSYLVFFTQFLRFTESNGQEDSSVSPSLQSWRLHLLCCEKHTGKPVVVFSCLVFLPRCVPPVYTNPSVVVSVVVVLVFFSYWLDLVFLSQCVPPVYPNPQSFATVSNVSVDQTQISAVLSSSNRKDKYLSNNRRVSQSSCCV